MPSLFLYWTVKFFGPREKKFKISSSTGISNLKSPKQGEISKGKRWVFFKENMRESVSM